MNSSIQRFVIATIFLIVGSPKASACWSEFVDVNSVNEGKYDIEVTVETRRNQQYFYRVKAPMVGDYKYCWLIVCKKEVEPKQRNFRQYIWTGESKRSDILLKARLVPTKETGIRSLWHKGISTPAKEVYIQFTVHRDLVSCSYIYIDFPSLTADGGYYYAIDLDSYLKKAGKQSAVRPKELGRQRR